MEENRTNVEVIKETTETTEAEKSTEITEVKDEKKGFHPIKATKKWAKNHPKATKVVVATAGFIAGAAATVAVIAKATRPNDETEIDDPETISNEIIDGDFTVLDASASEATEA